MANYKTGAQRYNDRMDKIWETARKNGAIGSDKKVYTEKGEGKSATESTRKEKCSICGKGHKTSIHATKNKALEAKKEERVTDKSDKYKRSLGRDAQLALGAKRLKTSRYDEFGRDKK